jgi:hypothetical protein
MLASQPRPHHQVVSRVSRLRSAWVLIGALAVAGCGGTPLVTADPSVAAAPSSAPPSAAPPSLAPPATTDPTASPAASAEASVPPDAAPIELQGTWANEGGTPNLRLLIGPVTYRITRDGNTGSGSISVNGDVIRFMAGTICDRDGDYRWTIDGGVLTLDPVEPDGCPGRARSLEDVSYVLLFPPS